MLKLNNTGIKILKIIHLFGACCWLGGACALLTINLGSHKATSASMLYGINYASHLVDLWIVVTFGVYVCLLTGFIYGFFTSWGFFKFKWLTCKWLITCLCFTSGWVFLGSWETAMMEMAKNLTDLNNPQYNLIRDRHFYLSLLQISLLAFMVIISVIKPWKKRREITD